MALKQIEKMDTGTTRLITISTPAFIDVTYGTPLTVPTTETNYTMEINNTVFGVLDISNFGQSYVGQGSFVSVYGINLSGTSGILNYHVLKNGSSLFTGSLSIQANGVFSLLFYHDFSDLAGNSMEINFWSTGSFEVDRYSIRNAVASYRTELEARNTFKDITLTGYEHTVSGTTRLVQGGFSKLIGLQKSKSESGNLYSDYSEIPIEFISTTSTVIFGQNSGYFNSEFGSYNFSQQLLSDLYEHATVYYSCPLVILSAISMDRE